MYELTLQIILLCNFFLFIVIKRFLMQAYNVIYDFWAQQFYKVV